jgi:hypothetical protein
MGTPQVLQALTVADAQVLASLVADALCVPGNKATN